MPLELKHDRPIVLIRQSAFERAGLIRSLLDERYNFTDDEFHVEDERKLAVLAYSLCSRRERSRDLEALLHDRPLLDERHPIFDPVDYNLRAC